MHYSLEAERRRRSPAVTVVAHGPLVEAIAAGDPDLAEKHASSHSLRFRQRFLHLLDRREVMDFDVRWLGYNKKPARRTGRQKA